MKKIILFVLMIALLLSGMAFAATMDVSGTGTVMVEADIVKISLGVSLIGKDLAETQQQMNQTVENVCKALMAQGVVEKDISTNYFYISPQYDYNAVRGDEKLAGYSVNNSLSIVTESIDTVGALIDAAFAAGANSFDSIEFSAKDDTDAQNRALELAVQNAMGKAKVIAAASGKQLGEIVFIDAANAAYSYSNAGSMTEEYAKAADTATGTTVRAAKLAVTANIKISYELI